MGLGAWGPTTRPTAHARPAARDRACDRHAGPELRRWAAGQLRSVDGRTKRASDANLYPGAAQSSSEGLLTIQRCVASQLLPHSIVIATGVTFLRHLARLARVQSRVMGRSETAARVGPFNTCLC